MKLISRSFLFAVCLVLFPIQFPYHPAGVEAALPCNGCHDYPPVDATGGRGVPEGAVVGSHAIHAGTGGYGLSCPVCHVTPNWTTPGHQNGLVEAAADISSGSYSKGTSFTRSNNPTMGTCANTYCHGNYPGSGLHATPTWGSSATAACGTCHDATNNPAPQSGSHYIHAGTGWNSSFVKCTVCHKDIVSGDFFNGYTIADKSKHANAFVDWKFDTSDPRILPTSAYSITAGSATPSDGTNPRAYGTCANVYCHSIVQTSTGGPLTGLAGEYKQTEVWGTYLGMNACGYCHAGGHSTAPQISSGSHSRHLEYGFNLGVNSAESCSICHDWDQTLPYNSGCGKCHGYAVQTYHVNGQIDVRFDPYWGSTTSYNGSSTPGAGFSNCSNAYCHSNGTGGTKNSGETRDSDTNTSPNWGTGHLFCNGCHSYPPSYTNGSPKANSHANHSGFECYLCHTRTGSTVVDTSYHVNGIYDVYPDALSGISFTYQYYADGGTCTSNTCHGNRKWDGTSMSLTNVLYFKSNADENSVSEPAPNAYLAASGTYYGITSYSTGTTGSPGRRFMSINPGTNQEDMQQTSVADAAGYYRIAQFVSPQITEAVTISSGSNFSLTIRGVQPDPFKYARVRYTLYQWLANDTQGINFRVIAQDSNYIPNSASNITISFTNNAGVAFSAGDKIVCEIEIYTFFPASGGPVTLSWGNSTSNARLVLPVQVKF